MKNLFKNLMLVAVAAMAFTACSQDNHEVNKLERKTVYNFQANIADDDTRSGFMEKEDGATAYKSEWFGDETIKVFVTDYNSYNVQLTTEISTEGKFELELTDAPESFFVTVVSPAESWVSEYTANIPAEQTPLANSVDPKAHLLQAQAVPVSGGVAEISMTHLAAYGKMTVKGVDFEINHVVIDLVGSYYGYDRELSYTIKADNVENNTFWFATEPIDVAEFTVTAYDAEGKAVAKTVDVAAADKTLSFSYGRVGTFSVSGLEVQAEKYDSTYAYVYEDYGANDKEIMFVAEDGRGLRIDFYDVYNDNCIVPGTYTFKGAGRMYPGWSYYYADVNGYYTSKLNDGQAVVSVEDGQYKIVFTNMADGSTVYVEQFTFKGLIDGIDFPDPRIKLAAPNVTSQITGKTIILDWEPVTGADSYLIEIYSDVETVEPVSTTDTHFEYTVKSYDSYYSFKVTAVVAEDNAEYRNSGYYSSVEYSDPREQLPAPTNVSATVDGLNVTISWDKVENAVGYEINYYDNGNITKSTTETSITLEMSTYNNEYCFYLSSLADENSDSYRSSGKYDAYTTVITGMDPNVQVVEFTTIRYVGTEVTDAQYDEYCNVFELTNSNNDKMTLYVGSYQSSSTYIAEGNYHYESKNNLGYVQTQWGFQSRVWNADGYVGMTGGNSVMEVTKSGDVYNIDFTLIINNQTHFFVCNAPIGVQQQPVALETPVVSSSVNGNEVVVSWFAINGAANYTVTLGSQSQTVNGTTVTFSNLEYSTSYTVSVVANPADTTANLASDAGTATFTTEEDPNAGGNEGGNEGGNDEWTGREVRLQLLAYNDNVLYTNVNNEGKYFMTSFRNGIVAGTFVLAGDNKSLEIITSGHATSQYGLFGGTTPFADGDTVEVINNGGGSYTIIYRVTINGEKLTATYTGGL